MCVHKLVKHIVCLFLLVTGAPPKACDAACMSAVCVQLSNTANTAVKYGRCRPIMKSLGSADPDRVIHYRDSYIVLGSYLHICL